MNYSKLIIILTFATSVFYFGCGVSVTSQAGGGAVAAAAAPANFAAGQAQIQNALNQANPPQVNFAAQPVAGAAANKNGAVFGVVIDANNGMARLQKAAVGLRSTSKVHKNIFSTVETNNPLTYAGGMVFEDTGTTLYVLDAVAQPGTNSTSNSGVIYSVNSVSNAVTEINLGTGPDLPLGLAYVNTTAIPNALYFTAKNSSGIGSIYKMTIGGTPSQVITSLNEPTGIVANDSQLFLYDVQGSKATISQVNLSTLVRTSIITADARPAAIPMAIANQSTFKALFYVDGETVQMLNIQSGSASTAAASKTEIMPIGKLTEISGLFYSDTDSTLLVSSETDKKVFKAAASSS